MQNSDEWRAVHVVGAARVADGVLELRLADPVGAALADWEPGAHIEVETAAGIRQYSLCGDRASDYTIAVLDEPLGRGGSRGLHVSAAVGTELRIRGPRNHFQLVDDADDYVLIAGGIGITPIKAMAQHLMATGRAWRLHYGGRSAASMAYVDEVRSLDPERVSVAPHDTDGDLDLAAILSDASPGTVVYCCGPPGLLDAAAVAVAESGAGELRIERFTAATPTTDDPAPGPVAGGVRVGDDTFVVELAASGIEVEVGPDTTILEAVRDRLPDVMSSCEDGYCGTCETPVLEGIPEHRDTVLTPSEQDANDTMMICVGRSRTRRLVLDL
ncbi:PDR/VanB family oxidoreductase [Nocardioides hwasunensis]|uniref:Oxidoreductase n=1 Tax=Nocardioides hwasunensis TaxID=397258 RepID=A0ABR8MP30_9ACTN|nr:PDR/VanB family oxidoreductase [Nocardioides hwasunensis]MBD3917056.1 oxidoreductase [Nocardioides hwasunensis]